MTLVIDAQKAEKKIDEYLFEIDRISKIPFNEGGTKLTDLNTRIRNFVEVAFSDSKNKLIAYDGIYVGLIGGAKNPQEKQMEYDERLRRKKRHLIAWKEEIELTAKTKTDSDKIEKLRSEIEEASLESSRREKVLESKAFGSMIELLTFQRELIKEKEKTSKAIIDIQKDISDIKSMLLEKMKKES